MSGYLIYISILDYSSQQLHLQIELHDDVTYDQNLGNITT